MNQPDLFGGETRVVESGRVSRKSLIGYHRAIGEENCSTCDNSFIVKGNTKNYRKCKILGDSASESTDVSRNFICCKFKKG